MHSLKTYLDQNSGRHSAEESLAQPFLYPKLTEVNIVKRKDGVGINVLFLAAVEGSQRRPDGTWFDGGIGIWPVQESSTA